MNIEVNFKRKGQWVAGTLIHIDHEDYGVIVAESGKIHGRKLYGKRIRVIDEDYLPKGNNVSEEPHIAKKVLVGMTHYVFTAKGSGARVGCTSAFTAEEALDEMPEKERGDYIAVSINEDKCLICKELTER
jgi:hypothetical protein